MRIIDADALIKNMVNTPIQAVQNIPFNAELYSKCADTACQMVDMVEDAPTIEAEPVKQTIACFCEYQIEWLTAHCDIEFCKEEENLIIRFLKDTAECFLAERRERGQDETD